MPRVTKICQQKDKNRVNIYLDGKFGFGLDLENFVKLKLKVEQELSDEEIENIKSEGKYTKFLSRLLEFASRRLRSEKEIRDWLKRKKVPESYYDKLLKKLQNLELLDDEKFTRFWVDSRLTFKKKSKKELIYELRQKGIDRNIIDDVLSESEIDEIKIAKDLVEKRLYKWEKFTTIEKKKKVSEFLARKGFGWEIINSVLKNS